MRVALERELRAGGEAVDRQRRSPTRPAERGELLQHVAAERVVLLVDPPAHARPREPLGVGGPAEARPRRGVVEAGTAAAALRVDRAGHPHHAVGPRRPEHRRVPRVADGERLGQRELHRQVRAGVVTHHVGRVHAVGAAVGGHPPVHPAAVPGVVLHLPGVRRRRDVRGARRPGVEVEREEVTRRVPRVGLLEHAGPAGEPERVRVGEAAHPGQGAEVVVERAVLLHEQHDVADVAQRRAAARRRRHDLAPHVRREERGGRRDRGRRRGRRQQPPPGQPRHDPLPNAATIRSISGSMLASSPCRATACR